MKIKELKLYIIFMQITTKIVNKDKDGVIIEAEVYRKLILMWLLNQGKMLEVLKPVSFRSEMKEIISEMIKKYE